MNSIDKIIEKRNIWMAVAIIWIILFHSYLRMPVHCLYAIKGIGYGGADMFLFASGVGCWFSLEKNEDPGNFIYRRAKKILPMYECFIVLWAIFRYLSDGISITELIGNIFCVQKLTGKGNEFNWYISAIWIMYFMAPFIYRLCKKYDTSIQQGTMLLMMFAVSIPFWHTTFLIIAARMPIFCLGMCIAQKWSNQKMLYKSEIFLLFSMTVLGFGVLYLGNTIFADMMVGRGGKWYAFFFIVPGLCLLISFLVELLYRTKVGIGLVKILDFVGHHTFEIYLMHLLVFDMYKYALNIRYLENKNIYWWLAILITGMGCFLLNGYTRGVVCLVNKAFRMALETRRKK